MVTDWHVIELFEKNLIFSTKRPSYQPPNWIKSENLISQLSQQVKLFKVISKAEWINKKNQLTLDLCPVQLSKVVSSVFCNLSFYFLVFRVFSEVVLINAKMFSVLFE